MIISLEGNIGSGKEAFISFMKKYFNDDILYFEDTVYNWEDKELLHNFYKDPSRWAFTVEVYSTTQKCHRFVESDLFMNKLVITKRSPMSDKACFVKACKQMKYMTEKEVRVYNSILNTFNIPMYDGVIYLRSNTNRCYENIISKQTGIEKTIDFNYIQTLNTNYDIWIKELKKDDIVILDLDIEQYRELDGNEMLQETLLNSITSTFPCMKQYLKTGFK